ncbi:MAG: SDR family oxidoreductase [Phycisphaerales bacterium]|nr:SDR family oxidoreductase [Hyphomonadaceae bacterium]
MRANTILILGARSDMARAIAHKFAAEGWHVQLAARRAASLQADCDDLRLRHGVDANAFEFDALKTETHSSFVSSLPLLPDVVVCCVGLLGEQERSEVDPAAAALVIRSNFEGPASILSAFAIPFAERRTGALVGISSVAGERGRASNYVYGSAKAGFTAFLSGLRNRLTRSGVSVITVVPGFVHTAMTQNMVLPPRLTAQPVEVAQAVFRAVRQKKDVIYVRRVWWAIMLAIRTVPEGVFKRMRL